MRRWRIATGRALVVGLTAAAAINAAVTLAGCARDGTAGFGPAPTSEPAAAASPPQLAPEVPRESWRPGYALVELVADAPPLSNAGTDTGTDITNAAASTEKLGGVRVQVLREVIPRKLTASAAGPIVLVKLVDAPVDDASATRRALAQLKSDARVSRVEPDRIRHLAALPNDPLLPQQWGLPMIHMAGAWELTKGSPSVVVAVLDTGIVYGHPDLDGRLLPGYDFISTPTSADDGDNSRDADPSDTGTPDTSRLHGIHVTGTIGASTDNGIGVAGVDQRCRLMPVRVLGINNGDGIDSDIADAVRWASGVQVGSLPRPQQPAQVINLSFGGPGISFTLQRAIADALSQGAVVIAAAGNGGDDAATYSPGGLDDVITVGAVDRNGARASYSNFGPRVDLLAPGGGFPDVSQGDEPDMAAVDLLGSPPDGILSTYRDEGIGEPGKPPFTYGMLIGTSQAAPHVSGAVALVKALLPRAGARATLQLLRDSADPGYRCPRAVLGGCGAGLLDVASLLQAAAAQARCGCSGDLYCMDGSCVEPSAIHPSIYDRPVIHGGYCELAGHPAGGPSKAGPRPAVLLFLALALARLARSRERHRCAQNVVRGSRHGIA